jgi:adenine-specific DNA-methyltransferase
MTQGIETEFIKAYRGTFTLPFKPGKCRRVAGKIIDDKEIESRKVVEVK